MKPLETEIYGDLPKNKWRSYYETQPADFFLDYSESC